MEKSSEHNIDINTKDAGDQTPFHSVCYNGHSEIAEMLIERSAEFNIDLNAKCIQKLTAFHYACKYGHSKVVEILMQKSADFNIKLDKTGFHLAKNSGKSDDVVNLIKRKRPRIAF